MSSHTSGGLPAGSPPGSAAISPPGSPQQGNRELEAWLYTIILLGAIEFLLLFIQEKSRLQINFIEDVDDAEVQHQQEEAPLRAKIWKTLKIQMKATMMITLFIFKEIVFSFLAYIDLICTSHLENFGAFVLRKLGYFRDIDYYVNPQRMFLVRGTETMRGRAKVTIRRTAAWFAFALLIPFVHESMMNMADTSLEAIHSSMASSWEHVLHSKKPISIEWEAGMEKTTFSDNTTSKLRFSTPSPLDDYEAYKATEPCSYGFFSSMMPKWLSTFNPNTIVCKSCQRFISMGGCDQSKDSLHDFALATLGSRVLTEFTSPTLGDEKDKGWVSTLVKKQQGIISQRSTSSPLAALLPWTRPGECWPMASKHGSLGVELSYPVAVKAISVDYLGQHQAVTMSSAPGDFEVWGLKKYDDDRSWKYPWDSLASVVDNDVIYIGRFMYDITKSLSVQTFELKHPSPPIKAVVFRFLSNWDQDDYTCIYRVRVHGDKVA